MTPDSRPGPFADYAEVTAWLEAWAERARVPVVAVLGDPLFTVVRVGYTAEAAQASWTGPGPISRVLKEARAADMSLELARR